MAAPDKLEKEVKRLSERCHKALQVQQKIAPRLQQLHAEMDTLVSESENADHQVSIALADYARVSCRQLCNKVYAAFPREVRDVIYFHLLPETLVSPFESNFGTCKLSHWASRHFLEHLTDAEYVGENIVREIEEVHLRTTTFLFADNYTSMPEFRLADLSKLGLVPAEFVMNIRLRIDCEDFDFPDLNTAGNQWDPWGNPKPQPRSNMLVRLEYLFGFRQGTKITIDLTVDWRQIREIASERWLMDHVVPLIFPTLCRLSVAGYKLKVRLSCDAYVLHVRGGNFSLEQWKEDFSKLEEKAREQLANAAAMWEAADEMEHGWNKKTLGHDHAVPNDGRCEDALLDLRTLFGDETAVQGAEELDDEDTVSDMGGGLFD